MKIVREQKKNIFDEMRLRAQREIKNRDDIGRSMIGGNMGKLKSFGELADSMTKLR
jgi:hypothetical protein